MGVSKHGVSNFSDNGAFTDTAIWDKRAARCGAETVKCPTCGGDTRVKSKHGDKRYRRCVSCSASIVTLEVEEVELAASKSTPGDVPPSPPPPTPDKESPEDILLLEALAKKWLYAALDERNKS